MKKKESKILLRAESILSSNKEKTSIYYKELKKSYKEYKELNNKDKTTKELYLLHINKLCDYISESNNATISIILMIIIFVLMLGLTTYSTYRYYDIARNLKDNIIKTNKKSSLVINYNNLDNFEALVVSDLNDYIDLTPLTLTVAALNNEDKKLHYNIYLIEQNEDVLDDNLLNRDVFLYNVKTNKTNTGIKSLKNVIIEKNRILIFSNEISAGEVDSVELRMWIDKDTKEEFLNKTYKFTIYVDGYEK